MKLELVIGNKNYSSWSMRPWVLLRRRGIPFEEVQLNFDEADAGCASPASRSIRPARKVPVLVIDGEPVWDSLAICETWPRCIPRSSSGPRTRPRARVARSICAEMHSGFQALRKAMPMNIRTRYPGKGLTPASQKDIDRIVALWTECRERFGGAGNFLFGRFSIADAFYAPVVMRFRTYAVKLPPVAQAYCEAVQRARAR